MIVGETYQIETSLGNIYTGNFRHHPHHNDLFLIAEHVLSYDTIEGVRKTSYVKKSIDKPVSRIGTPHG